SDYSIFQINDDLTLGENFILNLFDNSKVVSNKLTFNSDFTINFYNGSKLIAEDVTIEGNPNLNFYNSSSFQINDTLNILENSICNNIRFTCGSLLVNPGAQI